MNNTGSLLSHNRYMPFGEIRDDIASSPITQTDFGYTGQRNLSTMGLMDYRARFYSPLLGRFTQPDTIGVSLGSPQSLNRFAYVLNNPILFNDPSGHWCNASGTICADDTDSFGWWSRVDRESEGGSGDNNEPGGIDEDLDGGEGNGDGGGTPGNLDGDLSGDNEEVVYEWYGCLPECEGIQVVSNMVGNMTQEYQHSLAGLVPH